MAGTTELAATTTIDQVIALAQERVDIGPYTWAATGAGQGATIARNRKAIDRLALVPRMMQDVRHIDTTTNLLGIDLSMPIVTAPVGSTVLFDPMGTVAVAEAATRVGTATFCASLIRAKWEDVAATAPGRHFFQMYVMGDGHWIDEVTDRIQRAGFAGLAVTVDSAIPARRDAVARGGWDWRMEREGLPANLEPHGRDDSFKAAFTWRDFERLCATARLPVLIKGILSGEDARIAIEAGAAAIYVSNHGGRNVDHELATIDALEEIAQVVAGRVPIIIDGGFSRGADVIKALALGASVVALGRLQCWGLAIGGADGVERTLTILKDELAVTMGLIGCPNLAAITRDRVKQSFPPF